MRSTPAAVLGLALFAGASWAGPSLASSVPPRVSVAKTAAEIKSNWMTFFSGKTPVGKKVELLQDGAKFKSVIAAQSGLGATVSATVAKVSSVTKTTASVRYTIDLAGSPVLKNQLGKAVYEQRTWKVGDASFCALLSLEKTSAKACPK